MSEGAGSTVNDSEGSHDIDLDAPVSPSYSWTPRGIATADGLVQTPLISGARTVAMLCRVGKNETAGFMLSGGSAPNTGLTGNSAAYDVYLGGGNGVAPLLTRSNGSGPYRLNRGGWLVAFVDFDVARNTIIGFGGRHSASTSRCDDFEIALAAVWDRELTDTDRTQFYDFARQEIKARGTYIDWRDCPVVHDVVLCYGQSNTDGRAQVANLPLADQTRLSTQTYISASLASDATQWERALLEVGVNQRPNSPSQGGLASFGPEVGAAKAYDASGRTGSLMIVKAGVGSTWLAAGPNNTFATLNPAVGSLQTWHPDSIPTASLYHNALRHWWSIEADMLMAGIGPRLIALWWMQGEQDANDAAAAADYESNLGRLWERLRLHIGYPEDIRMIIGRIPDGSGGGPHTSTVRTGQANFAASRTDVSIIDTDAFPLAVDGVHFDAVGQPLLGTAFHDVTFDGSV